MEPGATSGDFLLGFQGQLRTVSDTDASLLRDRIGAAVTPLHPLEHKIVAGLAQRLQEQFGVGAATKVLLAAARHERTSEEARSSRGRLARLAPRTITSRAELDRALAIGATLVGVNNRDLKTFKVDINTSKQLSEKIPEEFVKVSESGISSVDSIRELRQYGFKGFLIGENFMKTSQPGMSAAEFIKELLQ